MSDIVVAGAGPAGLAAAAAATARGAHVTMLDAGTRAGGQYWRHGAGGLEPDLHHHRGVYSQLIAALDDARTLGLLTWHFAHQVWSVERQGDSWLVHAVDRGAPGRPTERTVAADVLVLATGAYDRQVPFPGWDLPGVMTVGGAQALLKGSGVAVGPRAVVAGTGPFLLPVAVGLAGRGTRVLGVYEANRPLRWVRHVPAVARQGAKLVEAAGYAAGLARHRVPFRTGWLVTAALGDDRLERVALTRVGANGQLDQRTTRTVDTDVLAIGVGFSVSTELAHQVGCALTETADGGVAVRVDATQSTSVPSVFAAGETTGVGGAQLALVEGRIAGASAADRVLSLIKRESRSIYDHETLLINDPVRRRRSDERETARLREFAAAMHAVHPVPSAWPDALAPTTIVCRCEEVDAAAVQDALDAGARDLRTVRLLSRAGMGWCQGRECGYAVACLTARHTGRPPDFTVKRPIATPVPLGLVAERAESGGPT